VDINTLPSYLKDKIQIVPYEGGEHWIWIAGVRNKLRTHKQPVVRYGGKLRFAARVICTILKKFDLNSKLQINHVQSCNNSLCVNPDHIYFGTQYENMQDREQLNTGRYRNKYECSVCFNPLKISPTTGHKYCQVCKNRRRDIWRKKNAETNTSNE